MRHPLAVDAHNHCRGSLLQRAAGWVGREVKQARRPERAQQQSKQAQMPRKVSTNAVACIWSMERLQSRHADTLLLGLRHSFPLRKPFDAAHEAALQAARPAPVFPSFTPIRTASPAHRPPSCRAAPPPAPQPPSCTSRRQSAGHSAEQVQRAIHLGANTQTTK